MRVALLGLGLIGGSIARALRPLEGWSVAAWTPTGAGPAAAVADGVAAAAPTPESAIDGADLVVLAGPPLECLGMLDQLAGVWHGALSPAATVTDVASTKATIVERADARGLSFVGGHPMAGREASGYGSSTPDLFVGRPWVVVPGEHAGPDDVRRVESLATAVGARPVPMSAADHDAAVAAISHLPLLAAAALVEAVGAWADDGAVDPGALARLAASGWRDSTRLALGDAAMGAGILATNAGPVAAVLGRLRAALDAWALDLARPEGPDAARVEARLSAARALAAAVRETGEA